MSEKLVLPSNLLVVTVNLGRKTHDSSPSISPSPFLVSISPHRSPSTPILLPPSPPLPCRFPARVDAASLDHTRVGAFAPLDSRCGAVLKDPVTWKSDPLAAMLYSLLPSRLPKCRRLLVLLLRTHLRLVAKLAGKTVHTATRAL